MTPDASGQRCRSCGQPRSPDHDAAAPGPTVRHPFMPTTADEVPPVALTAHVAIGNSDDKLTQEEWSTFIVDLDLILLAVAARVHGSWDSSPASPWQNHCVAFDVRAGRENDLRTALRGLVAKYRQDSIALNMSETELIT